MIDLSYKPKKETKKEEDMPAGGLILCLLPFAIFFWVVLTASICGGKFW